MIAKILQPETERPQTLGTVGVAGRSDAVNLLDAAAQGASEGMRLALNIAAMLVAFLALLALLDHLLALLGEGVQWAIAAVRGDPSPDLHWSLNALFGWAFYPLAWVMGIEAADCRAAGQLLGTKMVANEFVAYMDMAKLVAGSQPGQPAALSPRSQMILTYALCGFSNFGAIGIQLGGIGAMAPERRGDLAQLGLRAMLGGMIACCMTACVAGCLDGPIMNTLARLLGG